MNVYDLAFIYLYDCIINQKIPNVNIKYEILDIFFVFFYYILIKF